MIHGLTLSDKALEGDTCRVMKSLLVPLRSNTEKEWKYTDADYIKENISFRKIKLNNTNPNHSKWWKMSSYNRYHELADRIIGPPWPDHSIALDICNASWLSPDLCNSLTAQLLYVVKIHPSWFLYESISSMI